MPWYFPSYDRPARARGSGGHEGDASEPEGPGRLSSRLAVRPESVSAEREASQAGQPGEARLAEPAPSSGGAAEFSRQTTESLGAGTPLPSGLQNHFEAKFGRSLDDVRVHTDSKAAESAGSRGALAFASGSHIAFAAGQYAPRTPEGGELLGHELAHVVQQKQSGPAVQCQPAPAPAQPATGTVEGFRQYVLNPGQETDAGLQAALRMLDRYRPQVPLDKVRFAVLPEDERQSKLGGNLTEDGRSHWDKNDPVIELPQSALDDIAQHAQSPAAATTAAHAIIETLGHEMYHLWRAKQPAGSNPIRPAFEKEAGRRMEGVRQNWLDQVRGNPHIRREMHIPETRTIGKWEDLPEVERNKIEEGASQTDYIAGLYEHSAYLVEEIYAKIEELSYLRVQETRGTGPAVAAARAHVTELAHLVYFMHNVLRSAAAPDALITPDLLEKTESAILTFLRQRYPNRQDPTHDSYEVVFYLSAIRGGLPPLYDSTGALISVPPPGSRTR